MSAHKLTCVSGYWPIKSKFAGVDYDKWFRHALAINAPYVFFGNKEGLERLRKSRPPEYQDITRYVELDIPDFESYKYRKQVKTRPEHCPSVALALIWHEKIFMMQKAAKLDFFNSEFFMWADAGLCTYRLSPPPKIQFPNSGHLDILPRDKIIYSSSMPFRPDLFLQKDSQHLHHHVSGTYLMNKDIVDAACLRYKEKLSRTSNKFVYTDQVVWTKLFHETPGFFYKYADGYGALFSKMYKSAN